MEGCARGNKDENGETDRNQLVKNLNAVEWDQHVISQVRYCHSMLYLSIRYRGSRKFNSPKKKKKCELDFRGKLHLFFFFFLMTAEFKILSELTLGQYLSRQGAWGSSGEGERPG